MPTYRATINGYLSGGSVLAKWKGLVTAKSEAAAMKAAEKRAKDERGIIKAIYRKVTLAG